MAMRNFDSPPATTGIRGPILEIGTHVVQIVEATAAYDNGRPRLTLTVASVSPHSAGQTLSRVRYTIDSSIYDALGYAGRFPAHDDEDMDAVAAAALGRVFRAPCRMQKDSDKYRELGWPDRPTDDELAAATPYLRTFAPVKRETMPPADDNDELPF